LKKRAYVISFLYFISGKKRITTNYSLQMSQPLTPDEYHLMRALSAKNKQKALLNGVSIAYI